MQQEWQWLETWLAEHFPAMLASLNTGAPTETWNILEEGIGGALPESFKAFYAVHDGQGERHPTGFFFGLNFLNSARLYQQWNSWRELIQTEGPDWVTEMSEQSTSFPPNTVKPLYANLRWIPFAYDWGGNYLGIDLDPDSNGTVGQVINFGRDEDGKFVVADSFEAFIRWMIAQLERGNYHLTPHDEEYTDFGVKEHPETHFIDVARELFGETAQQ